MTISEYLDLHSAIYLYWYHTERACTAENDCYLAPHEPNSQYTLPVRCMRVSMTCTCKWLSALLIKNNHSA